MTYGTWISSVSTWPAAGWFSRAPTSFGTAAPNEVLC
jgi:hypothetical protein